LLDGTKKRTVPAEQLVLRFARRIWWIPDHSNQTKADGILRPNQALE
jgi:hypothetical protein